MVFGGSMAGCAETSVIKCIFITVNYNNVGYTKKFIESIVKLSTGNSDPEIIIVDNSSRKEDLAELDNIRLKNVIILKNKDNLGYFKALNVGLAFALSNRVKEYHGQRNFIIVGNNDLEIDRNFFNRLAEMTYSDDTLAIAPNIISNDGYNQNPHCVNRLSWRRKLGYRVYVSNYYLGKTIYWLVQQIKKIKGPRKNSEASRPQYIYMGIGACYILTEHFFSHFSRLDDRVFLWGEEALFAGQIASVGGKIWYEPGIIVYHNESSSVSAIPSREAYTIWKESFKIYSKYL